VFANWYDWFLVFFNEFGVVMGVECMLGMEVFEWVVWVWILLVEFNCVFNYLMFFGVYLLEFGVIILIFYVFCECEEI